MKYLCRLIIGSMAVMILSVDIAHVSAAEFDPVAYEIEVKLDPETHHLYANEKLRWSNTTATATEEIWFHLYLNAFANSQTSFMRGLGSGSLRGWAPGSRSPGWIRIDTLQLKDGTDLLSEMEFERPDDGNVNDFTVVRVPLPVPIVPGESVELEINFEAQLPWIVARTGFVDDFHLVAQWFPKIGVFEGERGWNCHQFFSEGEFFADFGSYRVAITIPENWVVGATGLEMAQTSSQGDTTTLFRARRIHDFAWCAAPTSLMEVVEADFDPGRDVPKPWLARAQRLLGLSAADLELPPMQLRMIVPRSQVVLVPRMLKAVRLSVAWFGLFYGPYPFPQLTVVSPPSGAEEAGGMEYLTFITTGADRLDAYPPFSWSSGIEAITVHEFGHQYFQGMLASNEFEEGWLDEGVTTFAENSCMTAMVEDGLAPQVRRLSFWGTERLAVALPSFPITVGRRAWEFRRRWHYYIASYSKTAVALRTIEGLIGSEAMAQGLRAYVEEFQFRHPTGGDLVATLSSAANQDLDWFFGQAIFGDATPDWTVLSVKQQPAPVPVEKRWEDPSWLEGNQNGVVGSADNDGIPPDSTDTRWVIDVELGRNGDFVAPVEVELTWAEGRTERRTWDGQERWVRWRLENSLPLEQVVIDPDGVWALETKRADNYWRSHATEGARPLWWFSASLRILGQLILPWG